MNGKKYKALMDEGFLFEGYDEVVEGDAGKDVEGTTENTAESDGPNNPHRGRMIP